MKKTLRLVLIVFFFLSPVWTFSQQKIKINKKDFQDETQGFREAWKFVMEGDYYYAKGKPYFATALNYYLRAYNYNSYNPELNYKMGACYLYTDKKFEALYYLKKSFEFYENVATDIHLLLGRAYQYNMLFDSAVIAYQKYKMNVSEKEKKRNPVNVDHFIQQCRNGVELLEDTVLVNIENLSDGINTSYDEYNTVMTSDQQQLYFTSRRPDSEAGKLNPMDNKFFEDIYVSYYRDSTWEKAQNIGKKINTRYHDAVVGISPDDTELFIYNSQKKNGEIYVSRNMGGRWRASSKFLKSYGSKYKETSVCLGPDKALYFVSDRPKSSYGGKDMYVCYVNEKGKWNKPENLGTVINTPYDEEGVHLSEDGNTLYFSSKGHNSMGGYDLFKSEMDSTGKWSRPVNMGFPINSPEDDLFYTPTKDTSVAYFSSIRKWGKGGKDILKITSVYPEPGPEPEPEPVIDTVFVVDTVVIEPPAEEFFLVKGHVWGKDTLTPVMAKLEFIDMDLNEVTATSISDNEKGFYTVKLKEKKNYGVEIVARGYMFFIDIIRVPSGYEGNELQQDFHLEKVEVGEKVVLRNIFFKLGKATLTPESFTELNRVVKLMESNPTMTIEISGHTDNTGSFEVNQRLSKARAKSVVDYLVQHGVGADRLTYEGYAYSQPVASNATAEGRAQNRRVEFKILSK